MVASLLFKVPNVAGIEDLFDVSDLKQGGSKLERLEAAKRQLVHAKDHFQSLVQFEHQSPQQATIQQQENARQSDCTKLTCDAIRSSYEVVDSGVYVVGGFCRLDGAQGPLADAIRFWQEDVVPIVDRALQLGLPTISTSTSFDSCFSPALVGDLIEVTVNSTFNPCHNFDKAQQILKFFRRVDNAVTLATRLPYIKFVARPLKIGNDRVLDFLEDWVQRFDRKCSAMNGTLRAYALKLFRALEAAREALEAVAATASVAMDVACTMVQIEQSLLFNQPPSNRRTYRAKRALESLMLEHPWSNGTDFNRRLNFDIAKFDTSILEDTIPLLEDVGNTLNAFAACANAVIQEIRDVLSVFNSFLQSSAFDSFLHTVALLEPIMLPIFEITDKLSFLQCPKELGIICDLDELVASSIQKILQAIGIPIDEMERAVHDLVDNVFGPLISLDMPDSYFPDLSGLDGIDVSELLIAPLGEKLSALQNLLTDVDLLGGAFGSTGVPDLTVPEVGDVEFLFQTGSLTSISFSCPAGEFPMVLAASANNPCGFSDFSGVAEVPCGIDDSSCDLDLVRFGGLPACPINPDNIFLDLQALNPSGSRALYLCLTKQQFLNFDSLPALVRDDAITNPPNAVFSIPFDTTSDNVRRRIFNTVSDGGNLDIRTLFKNSFDYTSTMACPGSGVEVLPVAIEWSHDMTRTDGTYFDYRYGGLNLEMKGSYICKVPLRDIAAPDDAFNIDFHVAYQQFSGPRNTDSKSAEYQCGTETDGMWAGQPIFCTNYLDVELEQDIRSLSMTCETDEVIQIMQVLSRYSGIRDKERGNFATESFVDETYRFTELCRNSDSCVFNGNSELKQKVCKDNLGANCGDYYNGAPPQTIRGTHSRVYRTTYECLSTCHAGFIQLPNENGTCTPCGIGRYRASGEEFCSFCEPGTFSNNQTTSSCESCPLGTYSDIPGSVGCTSCPAGSVTASDGAESIEKCVACPVDTYSDGSVCIQCGAGLTSNGNTTECFDVPAGNFNDGSGTRPCPPGYFSETLGATSCNACYAGSYARGYGSTDCRLCAPTTYSNSGGSQECRACPAKSASVEFGADKVEACLEIPPTVQYSSSVYDGVSCAELLVLDLATSDKSQTEINAIRAIRLSQVGDGICNVGPWNTEQCGWDGGDCCGPSCVVPALSEVAEDKLVSDLACGPTTFACLDPEYAGINCGPETFPCDSECRNEAPIDICRDLDLTSLASKHQGDGVCDQCLNIEEFDFDGGDCCVHTCLSQYNPVFANSCANSCFCKVQQVDFSPPEILFDNALFPDAVSTMQVYNVRQAPSAKALDLGAEVPVDFREERINGRCINEYDLVREWNAYDSSNNRGQIKSLIHVKDTTPPVVTPSTSRTVCTTWRAETDESQKGRFPMPITLDVCGDAPEAYCKTSSAAVFKKCNIGNCALNAEGHLILSNPNENGQGGSPSMDGCGFLQTIYRSALSLFTSTPPRQARNDIYSYEIEMETKDDCGNAVAFVDRMIVRASLRDLNEVIDTFEDCDVHCSYNDWDEDPSFPQPFLSCYCDDNLDKFCDWEELWRP